MPDVLPRKSIDSTPSPLLSPASPKEYPFPRLDVPGRTGSIHRSGSIAGKHGLSGRYAPSRRSSIASSVTSVGGALDSSSWTHSMQETAQNAISTLLQPPILRTGLQPHTSLPASSAHKAPTSRDIPPVTLTNITHVENSEFNAYLTQVGYLYDALQRVKESEIDDHPRLPRNASRPDDLTDLLEGEIVIGRSSKISVLSRQASLASLVSLTPESPKPKRRPSRQHRIPQGPTPLSTIPVVYFDDDFHLENPRTFDVVSERSEVVRPAPGTPDERKGSNGAVAAPRKALATNAILQEKLSWYMDTIEVHLINSISSASSSFFMALGSLRELRQEAAESVDRIGALREELNTLDCELAVGGLEVAKQRRKRENLTQLANTIHQLKHIVVGVSKCELLVQNGDMEKASDAVDALERLIIGEQSQTDAEFLDMQRQTNLRDLSDVSALQSISIDIDTLRFQIGKAYESQFIAVLLRDLRRSVSIVSAEDTLHRWSAASTRQRGQTREPLASPAYLSIDEDFRKTLKDNLNALHRARHISPAASAYRELVLKEVKSIIKKPLPSSIDDDNDSMVSVSTTVSRQATAQDRSAVLARNLRSLDSQAAEEMLLSIYLGVSESLRRLGVQVKVLLDVTSNLGESTSSDGTTSPRALSPTRISAMGSIDARMAGVSHANAAVVQQLQEEMHQALDVSNLVGQAVDIAQNQIVKVLRVRTEQSIHQTPTRFLRYFTLNLLFANECEAISGRGGLELKKVVNNHIKDYIRYTGDNEQQQLAQGMDNDRWDAKDFTANDEVVLNQILESIEEDPEAWTQGSKVWQHYDEPTIASAIETIATTATTNGVSSKEKVKSASIDENNFILPKSAILCLHGMSSFLEIITGIPSVTADVVMALISYLQFFNSRCSQLILGAGATRSVGLKNITTKHLALASQALSFISTIIPHVREFVRRHSGTGSAVATLMGEFDKVRRVYQEHQNNITEKLVEIMAGRAATHVKAMKTIRWDEASAAVVSPYMDTLVKETSTLHKVLSRHLPEAEVALIMQPVFKSYKEQWSKAYGDVQIGNEASKERIAQDVTYFNTKLSKINGFGDTGDNLVTLIQEKKVLRPIATSEKPEKLGKLQEPEEPEAAPVVLQQAVESDVASMTTNKHVQVMDAPATHIASEPSEDNANVPKEITTPN